MYTRVRLLAKKQGIGVYERIQMDFLCLRRVGIMSSSLQSLAVAGWETETLGSGAGRDSGPARGAEHGEGVREELVRNNFPVFPTPHPALSRMARCTTQVSASASSDVECSGWTFRWTVRMIPMRTVPRRRWGDVWSFFARRYQC